MEPVQIFVSGEPLMVLPDTKLCRICLRNVKNSRKLFTEKNSIELLNKIYECFQLTLKYKIYYPSSICVSCLEELNNAYNFRQNCETFEKRFASLCRENNSESKKNSNTAAFGSDDYTKSDHHFEDDNVKFDKDHFNQHNEVKEGYNNAFICSICKKVLKSEVSLTKHTVSMHQKRKHQGKVSGFGINRRYHCTKCLYNTPHSQTLVNHMRKHSGDRPFLCECGKSFTQSASLKAHRKTHSNTTYFTCSKCGKQFKHAFSLKKHLDVHEIGKFKCDICLKQLKSRRTLHDHMYRHYNVKNYNCEDCGKTFVTYSELLSHKKKHSTFKKVECHLCGYKTHTKKSLIVHLKRHAGDKSSKCDLCHMSFFTNGDLQRHKRVHTRDKPFPCPTCAQRFTHSTSLNKHMKSVHGIDCKWADLKIKNLRNDNIVVKMM